MIVLHSVFDCVVGGVVAPPPPPIGEVGGATVVGPVGPAAARVAAIKTVAMNGPILKSYYDLG